MKQGPIILANSMAMFLKGMTNDASDTNTGPNNKTHAGRATG